MLLHVIATCLLFATLGLAQDVTPLNPDSLNPNASHVCTTIVKQYYTALETYYYTEQLVTYTWCFAIPPRCQEVRTVTKQSTRTVTRSKDRKSYSCCEGYEPYVGFNYCIASCENQCNGHGNCILPDVCVCHEGFNGKYCDSSCAEGYWGQDCEKQCQCGSHGSCDAQTGNCICHVGYTGSDCSQPCQGAFGLHCIHPCVCENNATCDNIDGHCTCKPGFHGTYCHLPCADSTCVQTCQCQNGGTCHPDTGECVCLIGYMGKYCTETCDMWHWGFNCSSLCEDCYNGNCDPETGQCLCEMGFGGQHCQTECKRGFYGKDCLKACTCQNGGSCYYSDRIRTVSCNCSGTGHHGSVCQIRDCDETEYLLNGTCSACDCPWDTTDSCNVTSGACQCEPGYQGEKCNETCKMPFYGQDCTNYCQCPHGDCHHITGDCTGCYSGYIGPNCDQECPAGTWGINCAQNCSCLNGAKCHAKTGYCNCTLGFHGLYCAQRCPAGTYGYNCSGVCHCNNETAICSPYDGQCQCLSGYYGDQCENQCPPDTFGFHCQYECSCYTNGTASCNHKTGECNCIAGWKGVTCNSQCNEGTWGENCLKTCDCNNHGSCDQLTGDCVCYPGYVGPSCSQECSQGKYGFGCIEVCQNCSGGLVCDFKTGKCPQPGSCPAGFTGLYCQELCKDGYWGEACANPCADTCTGERGNCNPLTGKCRCFPGYTGVQCESECEAGKYGIACQKDCLCVEESTETCNHKTGQCTCRSGFIGNYCENPCEQGYWGPGCLFTCAAICTPPGASGACNFITGAPCQCVAGYEGDHCTIETKVSITEQQSADDETSTGVSPVVIAIAALAAILVIIIIIIVLYYGRRLRRMKEDNLRVEFNVNGTGTMDVSPTAHNHMQIGVVNPTYEAQNLNNEARYPHLSSRPTQAPQPPLTTKGDSCADRRTSGYYDDPDEERYTSLKALEDGATGMEVPKAAGDVNLEKPNYQSKVSDKYVFYTGPKVPNDAAERSRSPGSPFDQRSRTDDDYVSVQKPNNLYLAQQSYISEPSDAGILSTENTDDENLISDYPQPPSLAFVNSGFRSDADEGQLNDSVENDHTNVDINMPVSGPHSPAPRFSSNSFSSTSSEHSIKEISDPTQHGTYANDGASNATNVSFSNPYDTPKIGHSKSEESDQTSLSSGYLTPTVPGKFENPYDTPRTRRASNPYDIPKHGNSGVNSAGVVDPENHSAVSGVLSPDDIQLNQNATDSTRHETENWIKFGDGEVVVTEQSIA